MKVLTRAALLTPLAAFCAFSAQASLLTFTDGPDTLVVVDYPKGSLIFSDIDTLGGDDIVDLRGAERRFSAGSPACHQ